MNLTPQKITTFATCIDWAIWTYTEWLDKTSPFKTMWLYLGFWGPLSHSLCSPMHTDYGGKIHTRNPTVSFIQCSSVFDLVWFLQQAYRQDWWCLVVHPVMNLEQFREHIATLAELVGINHFRGGFYLKTHVCCHWWQNRNLRKLSRKLDSM